MSKKSAFTFDELMEFHKATDREYLMCLIQLFLMRLLK